MDDAVIKRQAGISFRECPVSNIDSPNDDLPRIRGGGEHDHRINGITS